MNAYRNYNNNTKALSKNLERLSSGYKINRAGDDAAGLAISEKMRAQISGLEAAQKNVKDGVSLVNTAEGAMQEIQDMLNRMVSLATQSANGTYDNEVDRKNLQAEVDQLKEEINRIADSANFNGIKLLDGSLDENSPIAASSAISNITTSEYSASGASPAFKASYVTNRPEAVTTQTNASFSVSLDDSAVTGAKTGDKFTLTIGGTKIEYEVQADGDVASASDLAGKLAACGFAKDANNEEFTGGAAGSADAAGKDTTAEWDDKTGQGTQADDGATATNNYISVDGHWYKMTATGNEIKFDQVDYMGTSGETINPDYAVSLKLDSAAGSTSDLTGTVNWQAQKTVSGAGIGTSHQAQATVDMDFSQLKNGDILIVGDKKYSFQIGDGSTANTTTGVTNIDLSAILRTEEDMSDSAKLEQAMTAITKAMGDAASTTWSTGNGGVKGTTGTLTFQSLSTYDGDSAGGTKAYIGGGSSGTVCDMRTEDTVMAQFVSQRADQPAKVSFDLDVTKIKAGDTVTIDGVTFEFSNGDGAEKGNVEVDLSSYGIEGGIASYQTANVFNALKTQIQAELGTTKYDITVDGNTMTLASKDVATTASTNEARIAAKVEVAGLVSGNSLTLQIGDTSDTYNQLKVSVGDMHVAAMVDENGVSIADINIGSQEGAQAAIDTIRSAINYVSAVRGNLGAISNRLDHTANNLSVMTENITDAESTIRDTDIAEEMMSYTKNNILVQSAQAMLAQANQVPQGVLQLLQ